MSELIEKILDYGIIRNGRKVYPVRAEYEPSDNTITYWGYGEEYGILYVEELGVEWSINK